MRSRDFPYERMEPVVMLAPATATGEAPNIANHAEGPPAPMPQCEPRSEPTLNPDVPMLLDAVDPRVFTLAEPPRQSRERTSYRLIDWLSAIALVVMSLAFAFALDRSLF
jgi:hypothetical protein